MKRIVGIAALGLMLTACGGSSSGGADQLAATPPPTTPASSAPASSVAGCQAAPAGKPSTQQFSTEPKLTISPTNYTAKVVTNCGTIVITLDGKHAPHTVNSFAFLAGKHFFDNSPCHRLTTSGIFVLQCGDPTGTGQGGPGYTIPDENLKGATYPAGTLAMANTGQPHTGGSQFFFCYADTSLPPQYTPFGKVVQGLGILKKVAHAGATPPGDGAPNQPVVIESFTVTKG
jgi:peptidyl-prolyl cis-trans isomerase B (cyclophilin B)